MASIKPRKRGGSSFKELDAEMQRNFSMKMGQLKRLKQDVHEDDSDSGVVFISHIPHGFYEPQMKKFFSQFGNIKRLRLSRSKKSGRSRGYAYIEFEFSEVAKVVAETMHNYLMYQKMLKCFYVPKEKLHPDTFKGCFRHFKRPRRREIAAARNNSLLESGKEHIMERQEKRVKSLQKKQDKLKEMGIDFKIEGLESEMNRLKESNPPAAKEPSRMPIPVAKAKGKTSRAKRQIKNPAKTKKGDGSIEKITDVAPVRAVTKSAGKKKKISEESISKSAPRAEKAKKAAVVGRQKGLSAAASAKRQTVKGKREVKSAKAISKTKSRKVGGGMGQKAKRLSL